MHRSNGCGVHVVLNSLAEEKLQASLRCLARHGRFLEIGKYDLSNNSPLGMALFLKNVSFHGILLDAIFEEDNPEWVQVSKLLTDGIKSGKQKMFLVNRPYSYSHGWTGKNVNWRLMHAGESFQMQIILPA